MSIFGKQLRGALRSTTVRANGAIGLGGLVLWLFTQFSESPFVTENVEVGSIIAGVMAAINIFQRFRTGKPLEER